MLKKPFRPVSLRVYPWLFFALVFFYQFFYIFQGIDFSDDGFNSTFYQQMFNDKVSVQYNFMYWFSGVIGGAWLYLFPKFGMLGLRIGAVLVNTGTLILTYKLLKKYINVSSLKVGLFFCVMLMSYHPMGLFYDHLTALFFVLITWLLFGGLTSNKLLKFFMAGILLSLNSFTRLPNASGLSLVVIIFYSGFLNKETIGNQLKQAMVLIAGFSITTGAILLIMRLTNQYTIFTDCLSLVSNMSKSSESTHGLRRVVKFFIKDYFSSLIYAGLLVVMIIISGTVRKYFEKRTKNWIIQTILLLVFGFLLIEVLKIQGTINGWLNMIRTLTGFFIISLCLIVSGKGDKDIKILASIGAIVAFATTVGSDGVIMGAGRYSLWIVLPITLDFFFNASYYLKGHPLIDIIKKNSRLESLTTSLVSLRRSSAVFRQVIILIFLFFLFFEFTYTWNDNRNRSKMVYPIDNDFLKGVFTTQSRATAINELLHESARYISKDDYVLAYGVIPLFHSMTATRPFTRNSWPMLYDQDVFKKELDGALKEQRVLPVVIYQKLKTVPNMNFPDDTTGRIAWDINQSRNTVIREFLKDNHYETAWENNAFRIYIPEARNTRR